MTAIIEEQTILLKKGEMSRMEKRRRDMASYSGFLPIFTIPIENGQF